MSPSLRRRLRGPAAWWLGAAVTLVTLVLVIPAVDTQALAEAGRTALDRPSTALAAVGAYLLAFLLRAVAWKRVLPAMSLGHGLAGIHLALGGNHVLPLRLGEPLRITSVVRRTDVDVASATASTVTLRAADIAAIVLLGLATGPAVVADLTGGWGWLLLPLAIAAVVVGVLWLKRLGFGADLRRPGGLVLLLTVSAWLLEAVVVHAVAGWAGVELTALQAVLVTSVTISAQILAIAPGGFGTYEAAATASLVSLGVDPGTALAIALATHALKTLYSLLAGGLAVITPAPSLIGRLRVPATASATVEEPAVAPSGPVVLFMPAYEEKDCITEVVRRVPDEVLGHRVELLIIDDGSTDGTAELAEQAGATVIRQGTNQGLGAAVRRGLAEGVARDAVAVVFCDADGEYAPEELDRMVAPILEDRADYVIGSRFDGDIERMLPHRRLGNRVLTHWVRFMTRDPQVNDGQSGYRALSPAAARAAEVIHDFNYAQVLTLDLVAKGFRYLEVPISYRFRETGESFVKLGRYLRAVVPAVWRELNDRADESAAVRAHVPQLSSATSR